MPNEQTSVPLFVANTVLTASQQNLSAGTGVPVFATTVTRDAAFGGSNKALAEGQLCYLSSTNVVQYYDGASWATVGPSTAGGLVHISTTSITAQTSVNIQGLFTSTYTNYRMVFSGVSTADSDLKIQLAVTSTAAASGYNSQRQQSSSSTVSTNQSTGQTSFYFFSPFSSNPNGGALEIYGPQVAEPTSFTSLGSRAENNIVINLFAGNHSTATAYDSVYILCSSAFTGTVSFYGYAKA